MIEKKDIVPDILPFEVTIRFYNLTRADTMDEVD